MVRSKASTSVIDHIIYLCGFPDDSNMVKFIRNKGWIDLSDVTTLSLDDTNDFETVSYKDQPLAHHVRKFRGFLLYYLRKCHELSFDNLDQDEVMMLNKQEFTSYCGSLDYHTDMHLSGYKKRAPKLVVIEDDHTVPFEGEHSTKISIDKVFIGSTFGTTTQLDDGTTKLDDDATTLDNDNSKLDNPNVADLWGVDVGNDYLKDKTKKKGYITGDPAFGACMTSDFDWDPGSYHNMIDDIYKFYGVKEVDNIREWGAMEKLISEWDDGEDHEMMNE
jgi:hypothetical protein